MRVRLTVGWLVLFSLVAAIGYAQQPVGRTLSLAEALDIARRNNPDYRSALNDRWGPSRQLLNSTLELFTPNVSIDGSYFHRSAGGKQFFQGLEFTPPGSSQRSGSLRLGYSLSGQSIANRGLAAADLRGAEQSIAGALITLETSVRSDYLNVLQATALAEVARRALERVTENLNLAQARFSVGQGTLIEVRNAEVDKRRAEVTLLRADQAIHNQTLLLFQRMGVPAPEPARVMLTDSFPVSVTSLELAPLISQALESNPTLRELRAQEESWRWRTRSVRSQYLPSLQFSASTGRNASRIDTTGARYESSVSPWQYSISLSLPLYDAFSRHSQIAATRQQQDDAMQRVRARELRLRSEVVAAHNAVEAAYRTIDLQRANKVASAEAFDLASQRYRVGSGTYLELLTARNAADQADADLVTAIYDYHRAIATLENAVGRPLR